MEARAVAVKMMNEDGGDQVVQRPELVDSDEAAQVRVAPDAHQAQSDMSTGPFASTQLIIRYTRFPTPTTLVTNCANKSRILGKAVTRCVLTFPTLTALSRYRD